MKANGWTHSFAIHSRGDWRERGEQIAHAIEFSNKNTSSWIARTYLFAQFITDQLQEGCDMIINLAAGLDARPYRMNLPALLQWIEVGFQKYLTTKRR